MEKLQNKLQHVQVPNNMCRNTGLEPFDILVYANIKRYMNSDTKEAYPSRDTLKRVIGSRADRIKDSITKLNGKYLTVYKKGKKNIYSFQKPYKGFEPFSIEFLDKTDLTPTEKAYIIATQQYMFKDLTEYGKVSFTTKELSELINMPEWEIWKCDRTLKDKGYLEVVKTKNRDFDTGLQRSEKIFNMKLLGQKIIWMLAKNNERIRQNTEQIKKLQRDLQIMKKLLQQKNKELKQAKTSKIQTQEELLLSLV